MAGAGGGGGEEGHRCEVVVREIGGKNLGGTEKEGVRVDLIKTHYKHVWHLKNYQ